jgi:hypothetical protein
MLTGQAIDFKKHLAIPSGLYVQFNNLNDHPTPMQGPYWTASTLNQLCMDYRQGGPKLLHWETGKVIAPTRVEEIHMTDTINQSVEHGAKHQ